MSNIFTHILQIVDGMIRSLDFVRPGTLEAVEYENGEPLGIIRLHGKQEITVDKIPMFTHYTGDGYGYEQALHLEERGLLFCFDYPLEEVTRDDEPPTEEGLNEGRHHAPQDAVFLPGVKLDSEGGMNSPIEADWFGHKSGTQRRIGEEGAYEIEHKDGHKVYVHDDEMLLEFVRDDDDTLSVLIDEDETIVDAPDRFKRFQNDPRTRMGVRENGTSRLGGRSVLGDADANRVNPNQEDSRADSPHTYQQVDERVEPMVDPATETNRNPASVRAATPIDMQGYEVRHSVWHRRLSDPQPGVNNPTSPAYFPGTIPIGYHWINLTEEELKVWWIDEQPHTVTVE